MRAAVFGAGSIGKSVAAYCAVRSGMETTLLDVDPAAVADLRRRGGYRIYESKTEFEQVDGVGASPASDGAGFAATADMIFTAVGPRGLEPVLRSVAEGFRARGEERPPLPVLLCENIPHVYELAEGILKKHDAPPERYTLIEASVERMTRPFPGENGERDVLAEPFLPLILNKARCGAVEPFERYPGLFHPTDRFDAYYHRKIYTNNLGHAVLGYGGHAKGHRLLADAMEDAELREWLNECLTLSGEVLQRQYGFTKSEIEGHISSLLNRFSNRNLEDETLRVIQGPIRKLSPDERIIGPGIRAEQCGLPMEPFARLAAAAMLDEHLNDPESVSLKALLQEGPERVLQEVCGLPPDSRLAQSIARRLRQAHG